jgi:hypothetical protein
MDGLRPDEAQGRDHHCEFISTNPSPNPCTGLVCTPGWRDGDGGMKVLWLWHDPEKWIPVSRLREALARLC